MEDAALQWVETFKQNVPPHVYAPVLSIALVLFLWFVKSIVFRRLHGFFKKTKIHWDDVLIHAVSMPLNLLILALGINVFVHLLPLDPAIDRIALRVLQGTIILSFIIFLSRLAEDAFKALPIRNAFSEGAHGMVVGLIRGFIIGIGILIYLDHIGISVTPILASLGVGSLAVALALQDTLSNFFAGIYIAVDRPVEKGHFVKLETGEEGYVVEVGWRSTRVRMLPNNIVVVPNNKIMSSTLTNYYLPEKEMAVLVQVGVHYSSNLEAVEKVTIEVGEDVMKTVQGGVSEFKPFIRYHTFDSSSINFTVILRAREFVDQYLIKHEFIKRLHKRYNQEGIVIPFPLRTLDVPKETVQNLKALLTR